MTAMTIRAPLARGRFLVLLIYGSLAAQIAEYVTYSTAHLPRAVNVFQFVAIAGVLAGWLGLWRITRAMIGHARQGLDERERALRNVTGWAAFRIMGTALAILAGGYVLLHDGLGWLSEPSSAALSLLAYAVWVVTWTLPSAILAWTQSAVVYDEG